MARSDYVSVVLPISGELFLTPSARARPHVLSRFAAPSTSTRVLCCCGVDKDFPGLAGTLSAGSTQWQLWWQFLVLISLLVLHGLYLLVDETPFHDDSFGRLIGAL